MDTTKTVCSAKAGHKSAGERNQFSKPMNQMTLGHGVAANISTIVNELTSYDFIEMDMTGYYRGMSN